MLYCVDDSLRQPGIGKSVVADYVADDIVGVLLDVDAERQVLVDVSDVQNEQDGAEYTALNYATFDVFIHSVSMLSIFTLCFRPLR